MEYAGVTFHNISEIEERSGLPGVHLRRMPAAVSERLSSLGQLNSQFAIGSEIRFVTPANRCRLYLSAMEAEATVLIYHGDRYRMFYRLQPGETTCLNLAMPESLASEEAAALKSNRFAPQVRRVMIHAIDLVFHRLDTFGHPVRPPRPDEVPARCWLAYGSSITMGCGDVYAGFSYPQLTARRLGVDVLNMGLGGACLCEPAIADFFASRQDWDFATFEVGVNMADVPYSTEEFESRVQYLVDTVAKAHPEKPIVLITPFTNWRHVLPCPPDVAARYRDYADTLRRLGSGKPWPNVSVIEGREILQNTDGLSTDLVHPSTYGCIEMAENLAAVLRSRFPR